MDSNTRRRMNSYSSNLEIVDIKSDQNDVCNSKMYLWFTHMREQLMKVIQERMALQCPTILSNNHILKVNTNQSSPESSLNFDFQPLEPLLTIPSPSDALRSLSNSSSSCTHFSSSFSQDSSQKLFEFSTRSPQLDNHPLDFSTKIKNISFPQLSSTPKRINLRNSFDTTQDRSYDSFTQESYTTSPEVDDRVSAFSRVTPKRINNQEVNLLFSCKLCPKTYSQASALKMHVRTHTLPCKCQHCGKSFSRKWLLKGHERTHTGERPYDCPTCGRSFADRSNLRAHMQTHQNDKRYKCSTCPRSFSRMGLLTKHLQQTECGYLSLQVPDR